MAPTAAAPTDQPMLALTGIHDPDQLVAFDPLASLGRRRLIAVDLIDAIERSGDSVLRAAFFERLVDSRGVYKRTYPGRFDTFDEQILHALMTSASPQSPLHVLDAAVSDGSATLGLIDRLDRSTKGEFRFTATDLEAGYLVLRARAGAKARVVATRGGEIVQMIVPPFVLGHPRLDSRFRYPLNRLMRPLLESWARRLIGRHRAGDRGVDARELIVAHPDFRARLARDNRIQLATWNILQPWPGPQMQIVRAMNVVNPNYFSPDEQSRIYAHLFAALAEGGLLAVGANDEAGSMVDGTIWRRENGKLVEVARSGVGCRSIQAAAELISSP